MQPQVDASTVNAGAFFSESRLLVPDFQRRYRWVVDEQVKDFWLDLHRGIGKGEYFLGLVILSDVGDRREVVDGQQRLVTLTVLANALRLAALKRGRRLVAESLRTVFLYSMDFETEREIARLELTDPDDAADLSVLLAARPTEELNLRADSAIHAAHQYLSDVLERDLGRHDDGALRVGQWTEFISKSLTFAVFDHPDRGAAFRVYEVINTRGKDLTPSELIKAYLIGSSGEDRREATHRRWRTIEEQLDAVGASDQLTTFVRHVVTLDHGYVTPRELYQVVSSNYREEAGVQELLRRLELNLPAYVQMIDPTTDVESSDARARALAIADALSLTRFRPLFLLAENNPEGDQRLEQILRILVPGSVTGQFGTGSIEAQFARAARRLRESGDWNGELQRLGELKPKREEFKLRLERGVSKQQAHVLRASCLQSSTLPTLVGFPHQVRPRNGVDWPGFDDDDYREYGGLLANWVLTRNERRPQGARSPQGVAEKLLSNTIDDEAPFGTSSPLEWSAEHVAKASEKLGERLAELWYADL